jgi:bifunctional DNA-binding transcriptional regulator/antitoxin component of YhaV-PrlF toxin-antitoxin module
VRYVTEVHEDVYGNAYIVFPDEMIKELDWTEGDTLVWSFDEDDRLILRKRQDDSSNEA